MGDTVFKIDQFQGDPKNTRVMCPRDKSHGPMFVDKTGSRMLCNDTKCPAEIGVPAELLAQIG